MDSPSELLPTIEVFLLMVQENPRGDLNVIASSSTSIGLLGIPAVYVSNILIEFNAVMASFLYISKKKLYRPAVLHILLQSRAMSKEVRAIVRVHFVMKTARDRSVKESFWMMKSE